jgi:hypothetical protein
VSISYYAFRGAVIGALFALLGGMPATALAKTYKADCTKATDLQKIIDSTVSGDTIEISGICMGNITIRDKALTLSGIGAGPNGITGTAANIEAVLVEYSRGTVLTGLTISNPHFTCIRIRFHSEVQMFDSNVSGCFAGAATGIWAQEGSTFTGTRLQLDNNLRGLGAFQDSRAWCYECDLNNNVRWAASSWNGSQVSLLDSAVTGISGLDARDHSYIDLDCLSHVSSHACSLSVSQRAGFAYTGARVVFYECGDFQGRVEAYEKAIVQLYGARQQAIQNGGNWVDTEASLRVEPGETGNAKLVGSTHINGFSHALFYGSGTELDGSLNCDSGGDAWVEPGIDLVTPGYTINGCDHAP